MDFSTSDYISAAALLIAIASAYYTKKQSDLAKISAHNDYRAHLAEKHAAYRNAAKQATEKHKATIRQLSADANVALDKATRLFDRYDTDQNNSRHLRHLINECSSMLYYAFKGQLGWQSGLNIYSRLMRVIHVEADDQPDSTTFDPSDYRTQFQREYFQNPNVCQENTLLSSAYFLNLIEQIRSRINPAERGRLLLEIQEILSAFNAHLKEAQPQLGETAELLDELLEEGKLDHFDLSESPKIYRRLRYRMATYDTLSHLQLLEIDSAHADRYYNFVSVSILNLTILQAVTGFNSWGWESQPA